jgi:hypothetical protein
MNRSVHSFGTMISLTVAACAPKAAIVMDFDEGPATFQGRVTDAQSGDPIPGAAVSVGWIYQGYTDRTGRFGIRGLRPGHYGVEVRHVWFRPESLSIELSKAPLVENVQLIRASAPCCDLLGEWTIELTLDSLGGQDLEPKAREVNGRLQFAAHFPHPIPRLLTRHKAPGAADEVGRFDIDFAPFWGDQLAPTLSTGVLGDSPDLLTEVLGVVYATDSVAVSLVPGLSHGGIALYGTIVADTVTGRWWQKATLMPGMRRAEGRFVMRRRH